MNTVNSTHSKIKAEIEGIEPGSLLFPTDFLAVGTPEAVHMSLSRLQKERVLIRLGKGIYLKPKENSVVGVIKPSLEEIAQAIAHKERVVIKPTGVAALNKLGLSTQVPMKVVYLTNGSPRTIKINKGAITFKRTTPKKLTSNSEILYLVRQALEGISNKELSADLRTKLLEKVKHEAPLMIREEAKFASTRVAGILYTFANEIERYA